MQPLRPHEHWHIDVSHLNICGTFYYLCSLLDGCSRFIVHWEIREQMVERDVEIIVQRAKEQYPEARQRIIGVLKTLPTARIIISHDWDFLAETSSEYLTVEGQHFTDAAPSHAHAHMHVHPLGNKPHEH